MSVAEDFPSFSSGEAYSMGPDALPQNLSVVPDLEAEIAADDTDVTELVSVQRVQYAEESGVPQNTFILYKNQMGNHDLISAEREVQLAKAMEAGIYASRIVTLATANEPGVEISRIRAEVDAAYKDEERTEKLVSIIVERATDARANQNLLLDYQQVANDGEKARAEFIEANLRMVIPIAAKFATNAQMAFEDVVQEGNVGLMTAVKTFDYTKGYKFITFAKLPIKQRIMRAFEEKGRSIRVSAREHYPTYQVDNTIRQLEADGVSPTTEAVAAVLDMPIEKVAERRNYPKLTASLDQPTSLTMDDPEESLLINLISARHSPDAYAAVTKGFMSEELHDAIALLDKQRQELLNLRFGLDGNEPMTYTQIGKMWGISRGAVTFMEDKTLEELRLLATRAELDAYLVDA